MKHIPLSAEKRTETGTEASHRARAAGFTPGVVIGHNEAPLAVQVSSSALINALRKGGGNAMVELTVDGQSTNAMIREFTRNPVSRRIEHVAFQRLSAHEAIETSVPIHLVGVSPAVEDGGILMQELNALHVRADSESIPTLIEADVSQLQMGHPLKASDIVLPEGVELVSSPDLVVAVINMPRVHAADEESAEAEVATAEAPATEA